MVKLGRNGASAAWRDVDTGGVGSVSFLGPSESVQRLIKRVLEARPKIEIKYE